MSNPLDREQFLAGYLAEAEDHLRSSSANLLAVESALKTGAPHTRPVRELFRSLHTLKGLSAMVGVEPIVEIAHQMESILRAADRSGLALSAEGVAVLLRGLQAIESRVRAVSERQPVPPPPEALLATLASLQADAPGARPGSGGRLVLEADLLAKLSAAEADQLVQGARAGRRAVRVDFVPSIARAEQGVTITQVRERVSRLGEIVKVIPRSQPGTGLFFTLFLLTDEADEKIIEAAHAEPARFAPVIVEAEAPRPAAEAADDADDGRMLRHGVVRVEVARLDDALEKLSALVVTRFRLARTIAALRDKGTDVRELNVALAEMSRQLRDLRGSIMRARMVSVSELLERVPLIVRGLAQATGKEVKLEIDAGRAELDKAVAERVFPAIVHLVRNAVDHALEPVAERARAGKERAGRIRVACFEHSDSQLELVVSDDGRGIDREAVARKAGRPLPATDAELLELIALPGLSTRDRADQTSGRGMGLDIVKRTVETLGGEMLLETSPGKGTKFTLRIPLSVSILDAFMFECAGHGFAVPMATIDELVELDDAKVHASPAPGRAAQVRLLERRGRVMPLFSLAERFELGGDVARARKALIVKRGGEPFAFAVDRMVGQQEIVIRPLEDPLVRVPGVSGTTDLGDGRPTLVVDLIALAETRDARAVHA